MLDVKLTPLERLPQVLPKSAKGRAICYNMFTREWYRPVSNDRSTWQSSIVGTSDNSKLVILANREYYLAVDQDDVARRLPVGKYLIPVSWYGGFQIIDSVSEATLLFDQRDGAELSLSVIYATGQGSARHRRLLRYDLTIHLWRISPWVIIREFAV